ncbi:RNA polymerase sigma-70 factor [Mucilaginibacter hurinus]|uniref:RNA polymerase sigma-70 factor n=1 Tax=Mucilaginibacter hurinus TaxID=2201324 RepID=A0A367GRH3_9SPHI|nr:RNA polymerase sigma-70 factor [Mucilaginibacter hurinus]RCH55301.1 RNA polymerase sigma-70 factor [Mucilaginibacter hurinus]
MYVAAQHQMWPDSKLLELLRLDDRNAFELLYNRYSAKIFKVANTLFRDKDVCEDLVQELFIDLWFKRHQLHIENLQAYLKVAIKNRVLVYVRTQKATIDVSVIEDLMDKYATDSKLMHDDIAKLLEESIAGLPEKCRQIFILSRKEYLSNKEIAARLNLSVKTVENQITIALRYLRTGLTDYLPVVALAAVLNN